jgi:ElaB/YqjD/DUF883 family membrane-anchored ribosome-binding protein
MSDIKQVASAAVDSAKVAVENEAKSVRERVVAFVRANALKAVGISAVAGAAFGHFVF